MTQAPPPTVLVVEDEAALRELIAESLEAQGFAVAQAADATDATERLAGFAYDALVVDLRLPDADGMEVLDAALARYPEIKAVVMTGFGGVEEAVKAIKRGAIDFLIKPFQLGQLAHVLHAGITERRLRIENAQLRAQLHDRFSFDNVVGRSPAMQHVFSTLELVSPMNSGVLIQGETGTGKELIARAIHRLSHRSQQAFVRLDCAAIPAGLLEAEVFGHERGAFTGAVARRIGRFELADRGTFFLDEVGEIPLDLQAKLLRVLQEREFERVGSSRTRRIDVRLIAASNRDLGQMVEARTFREDLYYRLNVFPIEMPPLRERGEDIPLLARHFLQLHARANNRSITAMEPGGLAALCRYAWPGNVRELSNIIERCVILTHGSTLHVPADALKSRGAVPAVDNSLAGAQRQHILQVLEGCHWVIAGPTGAAARLGMKRSSLQYRLQKLGIVRPT